MAGKTAILKTKPAYRYGLKLNKKGERLKKLTIKYESNPANFTTYMKCINNNTNNNNTIKYY